MLDQPYMTGNEKFLNRIKKYIPLLLSIDLIEANSMSHEPNMIDIYSASWGMLIIFAPSFFFLLMN
jgi:hypothetical protein